MPWLWRNMMQKPQGFSQSLSQSPEIWELDFNTWGLNVLQTLGESKTKPEKLGKTWGHHLQMVSDCAREDKDLTVRAQERAPRIGFSSVF